MIRVCGSLGRRPRGGVVPLRQPAARCAGCARRWACSSATALLLTLGFTERRRTFALVRVLGANTRQLGGFVWTEVLVTGAAGALLGASAGWVLSQMLVLTGVFDPPPEHLAVPWAYLGIVGGPPAVRLSPSCASSSVGLIAS